MDKIRFKIVHQLYLLNYIGGLFLELTEHILEVSP